MWAWLNRKGPVDYEGPPQEAAALSRQEALDGVDIRLSELAGIPPRQRTQGQWDELDRLLDRRARLTARSDMPVNQGRVDSIIQNCQENPR